MPEELSISFNELLATPGVGRTTPPPPSNLGTSIKVGAQSGAHAMLQAFQNVIGLPEKTAGLVSERTGQSTSDAMASVRQWVDDLQQSVAPTEKEYAAATADTTGKIVTGVSRMLVEAPVYSVATMLTKRPIVTMAAIDAMKDLHRGPAEAAKTAAISGAMGGAFSATRFIPGPRVGRAAAGAAIGASGAAVQGADAEGVAAGATLGAVMGGLHRGPARATRSLTTTPGENLPQEPLVVAPRPNRVTPGPQGGEIIEGPKDILPLTDIISSPSSLYRASDAATQVIVENVRAQREAAHLAAVWEAKYVKGFSGLSKAEQKDLIVNYLDNPKYDVGNLPATMPKKMQDAYRILRPLTEEVKGHIMWARKSAGLMAEDVEKWGFEKGWFPHHFEGNWGTMYGGVLIPTGFLANTKKQGYQNGVDFAKANGLPTSEIKVIPWTKEMTEQYLRNGTVHVGPQRPSAQRFFGHAQQRASNMPGWAATPEALGTYLSQAARYATLAPMRPRMMAVESAFRAEGSHTAADAWRAYMDSFEGRSGKYISALNRKLAGGKFGAEPFAVERAINVARSFQTFLKLGFSPITVLANMSQVPLNVYPVLGAKYTMRGIKGYMDTLENGTYDWLLAKLRVRDAVSKMEELSAVERIQHAMRKGGWQSGLNAANAFALAGFSRQEIANRAVAGIGAYERSMAKYLKAGMNEGAAKAKAIEDAVRLDMRTNFAYGPEDAARIFRNPAGKLAFQFRSFMQKQIEFFLNLHREKALVRWDSRKQEIGRFWLATLSLSGVGGIMGAEPLNNLIKWLSGGYSPLDEVREKYPRVSRGAMAFLPLAEFRRTDPATGKETSEVAGIDMSHVSGFSDYFSTRNLNNPFGPLPTEVSAILKAYFATNPGRERDEALHAAGRSIYPMVRRVVESGLLEELGIREGKTAFLDPKGRVVIPDPTLRQKVMLALGGTPLELAERREQYSADYDTSERWMSKRNGLVDEMVRAFREWENATTDAAKKSAEAKINDIDKRATEAGFGNITPSAVRRHRNVEEPMMERQQREKWRRLQPAAATPPPPTVAAPPRTTRSVEEGIPFSELLK